MPTIDITPYIPLVFLIWGVIAAVSFFILRNEIKKERQSNKEKVLWNYQDTLCGVFFSILLWPLILLSCFE